MKNIVVCVLLVSIVGLTGCAPIVPVQPIITYTPSNITAPAPVITPAVNPIIITPNVNLLVTPPPPDLIRPENSATDVPVNTDFTWAFVGNITYEVQISTTQTFANLTANFSGLLSNQNTILSYGLPGAGVLTANATYYWRVRTTAGNLSSPWSSATFNTGDKLVSVLSPFRP